MSRGAIFDFVLFQVVWLVCALGAGHGKSWPGLLAVTIFGAFVLSRADAPRRTFLVMVIAGGIGLAAETGLIATGFIRHAESWPVAGLAPAWIVGLWFAFGGTLQATVQVLGSMLFVKAVLLGAVFSPLAYFAGARLGALTMAEPLLSTCGAISGVWMMGLPVLLIAQRTIEQRRCGV